MNYLKVLTEAAVAHLGVRGHHCVWEGRGGRVERVCPGPLLPPARRAPWGAWLHLPPAPLTLGTSPIALK